MSDYQARRVSVAVRTERAGTATLVNQVSEAVGSVNAMLTSAPVEALQNE